MKKLFYILLFLMACSFSEAQTSRNSGTITNYVGGSFTFKSGTLENTEQIINEGEMKFEKASLISTGHIENESSTFDGKIFLSNQGGTILNQDSISGYVEFNSTIPDNGSFQIVPILSYEKIKLSGIRKRVQKRGDDKSNILEARDLFVSDNSAVMRKMTSDVEIISYKRTEHDGLFETPSSLFQFTKGGEGDDALVNGTGQFQVLKIDNPKDVDITRGGFKVNNKLILNRGKLNNSTTANFTVAKDAEIIVHPAGQYPANLEMADETSIERYPASSMNINPEYEGTVSVRYLGDSHMVTTGEMPREDGVLENLEVENMSGVILTHDIYVNDRTTIASKLITDTDSTGTNQIVIKSAGTVMGFAQDSAEIVGTVTRVDLEAGRDILFNNKYTFLNFKQGQNDLTADGGLIDTVKVKVIAQADWNTQTQWGATAIPDAHLRVKRIFDIKALDKQNNNYNFSDSGATFGYAWRNFGQGKETPSSAQVDFNDLILMRLFSEDNGASFNWKEQLDTIKGKNDGVWAHSKSRLNGKLDGHFGIGLNPVDFLKMLARVTLEGPYNSQTKMMNTSLQDSNYLPITRPLDIYPYNLDPSRENINLSVLPDSVVDWIVLEFREDLYDPVAESKRFYRTCLLHADGSILDFNGSKDLRLSSDNTRSSDGNVIDSTGQTLYHIAIRHRNHLTVVTEQAFDLRILQSDSTVLDFTKKFSEIASNNMKLLANDNGNPTWAMLAGNVKRENYEPAIPDPDREYDPSMIYIDEVDYQEIWDYLGTKGYIRTDVKLDGIVTTKDYNTSWNNRNKTSIIKGANGE